MTDRKALAATRDRDEADKELTKLEAAKKKLVDKRREVAKDDTLSEAERMGEVASLWHQIQALDEQILPLLPPEAK